MNIAKRLLGAKLVATFVLQISAVFVTAQSWQASADYSSVQGHNNWRYMTYLPGGGGVPGTYAPMAFRQNFYSFGSWPISSGRSTTSMSSSKTPTTSPTASYSRDY